MHPVRIVHLKRRYRTFSSEWTDSDLLLGGKLKIPDGVNIESNGSDKVKYPPCAC